MLDSHPFTLAWTNLKDSPSLTFFARSRSGFTTRLFESVDEKSKGHASVWVDGPYGGIDAKLDRSYDHAILVAGGIGITGCLPWLQHLINRQGVDGTLISSLKLVWVVHQASHIEWAEEYLRSLSESTAAEMLTIEIYCTSLARGDETLSAAISGASDLEKGDTASEKVTAAENLRTWKPQPGRPSMSSILGNFTDGSVVVIGK